MTTLHGKEINVGDKVWDYITGWNEVMAFVPESIMQIRTNYAVYDINGRYSPKYKSPTLFWQEFEIPKKAFEKPKVMVKKYLVLHEGVGKGEDGFYTTQNWGKKYYLSKDEFYKANSGLPYKFISLIMESEIEVAE